MANTEVLLLEAIKGLGSEGDTVSVRAGYARNFLLPRKLATPINQANKKQIEALLLAKEKRIEKELEESKTLAEKIAQLSIVIAVKTGDNGKMFGSVTANDVLVQLSEQGVDIAKKQLSLDQPLKDLGLHTIQVKLASDIEVKFKLEIVSENPIADTVDTEVEVEAEASKD